MVVNDSLVGQQIGQYEILEKIGQGGMAEVYKGRHPILHRHVAIKVLGRHLDVNAQVTARFQREAQAVAALRHPNVVQIYDFGRYEGGYYMVMEYVEGTDLRGEIDRRRREGEAFTPQEVIDVAEQLDSALDYAHAEGVIHRDVKPGNVLLNTRGEAILGDFGLAMLRNRLSQITVGHAFGTPEYIAPEQAMESSAATPRSDIYSLGGILYEMITGELPFEADSAISLALKHINEEPPPLRDFVPALPPAVETVVLKALAKEPAQRYHSAAALVVALKQAWSDEEVEETLVVTRERNHATPPPASPTPPPASVPPEETPPHTHQVKTKCSSYTPCHNFLLSRKWLKSKSKGDRH
jgi:serine/threonine-protein kinase